VPNERPSLDAALASYDRASAHEHIALGEQERKEVTDRFPIDQWPTMPERYALGQDIGRHILPVMGPLSISSIGLGTKLIIYKHKDKPGWYFDPEYEDEQEAWVAVRQAFVQAFEKAKAGDWNTIDDLTPLSGGPALRLKTLRVYFPTDVLPIASKQHLRHFLRALDRPDRRA
jgi:5-methylcytosine-specific restriction protein B